MTGRELLDSAHQRRDVLAAVPEFDDQGDRRNDGVAEEAGPADANRHRLAEQGLDLARRDPCSFDLRNDPLGVLVEVLAEQLVADTIEDLARQPRDSELLHSLLAGLDASELEDAEARGRELLGEAPGSLGLLRSKCRRDG